jgi:hypothetical protein
MGQYFTYQCSSIPKSLKQPLQHTKKDTQDLKIAKHWLEPFSNQIGSIASYAREKIGYFSTKRYNKRMTTPTQPSKPNKKQTASEFLLEFAASIPKDIPESELEKLPSDGAVNHDHYLYGAPKR